MDINLEKKLLELALERGLITKLDISNLEGETLQVNPTFQKQWGTRLSSLVQNKLLTEMQLQKLATELNPEQTETLEQNSESTAITQVALEPITKDSIADFSTVSVPPTLEAITTPLPAKNVVIKTSKSYQNFPVKKWERYEFISLIGQGGMGKVYKALDPKLQRYVALKFILSKNAKSIDRFFQEAKSQAKIDHHHICKVYEVGEVEGLPYIAMQFIEGKSLKDASPEMTLEQKVQIIKLAAQALHSAHTQSLIHRDIKPANIMLEKNEDTSWHPFIMDFGLARDFSEHGSTLPGEILGTPAYMSPEQAQGENQHLDRRTDVYSLGATLYELVTNKPPFSGGVGMDLVMKVIKNKPLPVSELNPQIPLDLEAIIMKCLEKEPSKRYESAKALASDLERYIQNEPIEARNTNLAYYLSKKVKKYKVLASVISISLILLTFSLGLFIRERALASEKAHLAEIFAQEAEKINSIMKVAYLLPSHDITSDKAEVKEQMKKIEEQMQKVGKLSQGPGHYALGSGYLALRDLKNACEHLQLAVDSGYKNPEVNYNLGKALGLYFSDLLYKAEQITDKEAREEKIKEIEKNYRDKALLYLNSSQNNILGSRSYVEGLIAFYQKNYKLSIKQAKQAFEETPSLYDAKLLESNSYVQIGTNKFFESQYEQAIENLKKAEELNNQAIEIARSDPEVYVISSQIKFLIAQVNSSKGNFSEDLYNSALSDIAKASEIDPTRVKTYLGKSNIYKFYGRFQMDFGKNPLDTFDKSIEVSQKVLELEPNNTQAFLNIGVSNIYKGNYQSAHGLDPLQYWQNANQNFEKAIELDPNNYEGYTSLGSTYWYIGMYQLRQGIDPIKALNKAIDYNTKAVEKFPDLTPAYLFRANAFEIKGEYESSIGLDPTVSLNNAVENYTKMLKLNSKEFGAYASMGIAYRSQSKYLFFLGLDPEKTLAQSLENFQKAINLIQAPVFYSWQSEAILIKALYELEKGSDPSATLEQALKSVNQAIEKNPNDYESYVNQAKIQLAKARWLIKKGESPEVAFNEAIKVVEKSIQLNIKSTEAYKTKTEICLYQTQWKLSQKKNPQVEIQKGLESATKALAINSQLAEIIALKAALSLNEAKIETSQTKKQELIDSAQKDLEQAFKINSLLKKQYENLLGRINK